MYPIILTMSDTFVLFLSNSALLAFMRQWLVYDDDDDDVHNQSWYCWLLSVEYKTLTLSGCNYLIAVSELNYASVL